MLRLLKYWIMYHLLFIFTVTLSMASLEGKHYFKGCLIEARNAGNLEEKVGSFKLISPDISQLLTCDSKEVSDCSILLLRTKYVLQHWMNDSLIKNILSEYIFLVFVINLNWIFKNKIGNGMKTLLHQINIIFNMHRALLWVIPMNPIRLRSRWSG